MNILWFWKVYWHNNILIYKIIYTSVWRILATTELHRSHHCTTGAGPGPVQDWSPTSLWWSIIVFWYFLLILLSDPRWRGPVQDRSRTGPWPVCDDQLLFLVFSTNFVVWSPMGPDSSLIIMDSSLIIMDSSQPGPGPSWTSLGHTPEQSWTHHWSSWTHHWPVCDIQNAK